MAPLRDAITPPKGCFLCSCQPLNRNPKGAPTIQQLTILATVTSYDPFDPSPERNRTTQNRFMQFTLAKYQRSRKNCSERDTGVVRVSLENGNFCTLSVLFNQVPGGVRQEQPPLVNRFLSLPGCVIVTLANDGTEAAAGGKYSSVKLNESASDRVAGRRWPASCSGWRQ